MCPHATKKDSLAIPTIVRRYGSGYIRVPQDTHKPHTNTHYYAGDKNKLTVHSKESLKKIM
jgi:hypothetical protein